ncbi:MAG TPA: AgmX/PglI C-terminal domain-containing protein, partial [Kofleriaceae bacterium]|nr:AgmX/PglI C-terminal domain-containing protein [Kofleriaceae bacterium]
GGGRKPAGGSGSPAGPHVSRVPVEDTEPDDGVEFTSSRGRMDPAAIEAGLAPHKEDLGACYTTRVGKRTWLRGHVSIHWDIHKDGTVAAVKLAESDLGAWPIEKCLLETARAATFGKPIGGDADFSLPLDFASKGRLELWDEDRALRAVGGQLVTLDACDRAKGAKGPPPEDVTITVYVGPHGKAQSAGFASPRSVLDDAWAECAEKAALAWRLPDPRGTVAKLAVRYRAPQP